MDNARTRAGVRVAFEPCSAHLGGGACEGIANVLVGDHRDRTDDRKSYGQALVEFAIVLPIAVLILAAIIQFASIFERQIGIENAGREAARAAAALTTNDTNAATNAGWAYSRLTDPGGLLASNVQGYTPGAASVQVCYDNGPTDPAGNGQILVSVTIRYLHPLFVPIISGILDGIDGTTDGNLTVTTNTQFHDENAEDTSVALSGAPVCAP